MNHKHINYLLAGIILIGGVFSYFFYEKGLYFDKKASFLANYKSNYDKDSLILVSSDFLTNISKQDQLEQSEFNITIHKKDSLVYWNKEKDVLFAPTNIFKKFNRDQLTYKIALDVQHSVDYRSPIVDSTLFWMWLLGLSFLLIYLYQLDNKIKLIPNRALVNSALILCLSGLTFYVAAYFTGNILFKHSHYFGSGEAYTPLPLWLFGLNNVFIAYGFLHLHKHAVKQWIKNVFPGVRYFLASLLISALIYYLIACIEMMIESSTVHIKTDEWLNLGYAEFSFIIVVSLSLFLVIYLARQFFFASPRIIKVWSKTMYFALPLLATTLVFILLGFKTNTIGIVLFIMLLFLLLDLYLEYFEINLGFLMSAVMIFSMFASALLYKNATRVDENKIISASKQCHKSISNKDQSILNAINDSIISSTLFPSLSNLPYPQSVDVNDLASFIRHRQQNNMQSFAMAKIYCYDNKGYSLALNQISNRDKINHLLSVSDQIKDHVYYSPFDHIALLYYVIDNATEPTNPIHLAILFENKKKEEITLPYKSSLAVYKKNLLIKTYNEDAYYPQMLDGSTLASIRQINTIGDYIIVTKQSKKFIGRFLPMVTLFISVIGVLLLILILLNSFFLFISEKHHLSFNTKKSLRSRFQTTIIGLILFSFTLIGATTAFYYNKLYALKNSETFTILLSLITKEIQTELPEVEDGNDARLERTFSRLQNMHPLPLAFYSGDGEKILATDDFKTAPQRLIKSHLRQLVAENAQKNVKVISNIYNKHQVIIPVYNAQNNISGCFLTEDISQTSQYAGLFDFIATLLTVCVFLFLTALALSMIISTPMTQSLKNLAQRLKTFKLGKTNEQLVWKNPDEIGSLIDNFNKMQVELNQSADLLSRTQRDLAWREMAKQVAHEIKNPLTPMKLSIQHMQMAATTADQEKMKNLIQKTSGTILEQIENLTQIADEFSSFGTLPKASNDTIALNEVVEHIHDLFRKREDMDIQMDEPMNDIYVFADKNQLVRILNNIVKNATQSIPENMRGKINIELSQTDQVAIIKVSDNGIGIPEHMREKVFTPNFTTKSSGTGLGLAISSNMIESMNGRIYFNSPNEMNGTDFFIELPLMRSINNGDEVSLDG